VVGDLRRRAFDGPVSFMPARVSPGEPPRIGETIAACRRKKGDK
jgi:hypothetical protein